MQQSRETNHLPFELDLKFKDPLRKAMFGLLKGPLEKFLRLQALNKVYTLVGDHATDSPFTGAALDVLNVELDLTDEDRARIPAEGRVVVVANHPFGAIEGIVLASLLREVRSDVKLLANYLLMRIPEMRPYLIAVDPFGSHRSTALNHRPMREAVQWLRDESMLGVFPAGEVAHWQVKRRRVIDPKWSSTVARLVRCTEAPVLPIYFDGRNSTLFQIMGLVHRRLRTIMLPHELLNKSNRSIPIRIGRLIPYRRLSKIEDDNDLLQYLRMRTYLLENRPARVTVPAGLPESDDPSVESLAPVIGPEGPGVLRREIAELPKEALLATHGGYAVYCARAEDTPHILREIGRLREITFREVGEGTGQATDIDDFDGYYVHLFVWNPDTDEVVGAYRLGLCDEILDTRGHKGLYTRTLYKYKRKLIDQISPAVELGRSFIRPEYQREYAPLHLLWKGIGEYLVRHPHYRFLFGPVSISSRFDSASRQLMVNFLKFNRYDQALAQLVKAMSPPKHKRKSGHLEDAMKSRLVTDIDEVTDLIAEIESTPMGVPVLLRHYLRLGGKLLAFNVDSNFSDCLDGLILVDVAQTDPKILSRYMGKDGAAEYLTFHQESGALARS